MRWMLVWLGIAACSSGGGPTPAPTASLDASVVVPDAAAGEPLDDAEPAPDPAVPAEQLLRDGRAATQKQQWAKALALLDQAAAGGDVTALAELAFTATLAGDARRAARAAQAVIDAPGADLPARATAYYHLGRAAELRGDTAGARVAYEASLALRPLTQASDRLTALASVRRRGPPPPPTPPCNKPVPAADLCDCLRTALQLDTARCVASHDKHGGGAYAVTMVTREQAPTFLVATPAGTKTRQVLARLGVTTASTPDAELTITRWNVLDGPDDAALIRVDAAMGQRDTTGKLRGFREDALVCVAGGSPRCLALVPVMEKVGTPSAVRTLDLAIEATEDDGVAHVTLRTGPPSPATLLGSHPLW